MKYIIICFFIIINSYAQNNTYYVIIDSKLDSIYTFEKLKGCSRIKIFKNAKSKVRYKTKRSKPHEPHDIVILEDQNSNNYYEFMSCRDPKIVYNINYLKKYKLTDIYDNSSSFKYFWNNYTNTIVFIEKLKNKYKFWEMSTGYSE